MSDKQKDKAGILLRSITDSLKTDREIWEPLVKAAERYHATLKVMQASAMQFYDAMNKVAETAANANSGVNDLGVGIHQIADTMKKIEGKRTEMLRALLEEFTTPLSNTYKGYEKFATKFEKDYAKDHKQALNDLKSAEKDSAKAAKKGSDALQQAVTNVSNRVKEIQELTKRTLKDAIIEQRKRYCFVIMHFAPVIKAEVDMHDWAVSELRGSLSSWVQLAVSPDTLPPAVEELVEVQQRTFVAIQADENYSDYYGDSGYNTIGRGTFSSSLSSSSQDIPLSAPPTAPPSTDTVIRAGDNVKGIYDYDGDGDKLSFREGDIISVLEADGSGWCLGDLRGMVGWFPSNYVEKVKATAPLVPAFSPPPPKAAPQPYTPPAAAYTPPQAYSAPSFAPAPPAAPSFAPPPPAAPTFAPAPPPPPPAASGGAGRGALLDSIQAGTRLKKAVTNDRSTPKFK